jgi:hypothetical protein
VHARQSRRRSLPPSPEWCGNGYAWSVGYTLTVTLTPRGGQTHLAWIQEFETPDAAAKLRHIAYPANEQNLDRLQALLREESKNAR